jgi:hypothetical protein
MFIWGTSGAFLRIKQPTFRFPKGREISRLAERLLALHYGVCLLYQRASINKKLDLTSFSMAVFLKLWDESQWWGGWRWDLKKKNYLRLTWRWNVHNCKNTPLGKRKALILVRWDYMFFFSGKCLQNAKHLTITALLQAYVMSLSTVPFIERTVHVTGYLFPTPQLTLAIPSTPRKTRLVWSGEVSWENANMLQFMATIKSVGYEICS